MPETDIGRRRQRDVYVAGLAGRRPLVSTDMTRLEERARHVMSAEGFAYVAGGAGAESTMRANRSAFERWRIVPRMLRDVERRDTSVELFGLSLPSPFLLAPIGVLEMAHRQADRAVARAAAAEGIPMIFSNQASVAMEACAAVMGEAPRWFQLYWSRSDALVESFVRRAERCGCTAIVLTLDTTMLGWRPRDLDLGYVPFLRGKGIAQYVTDPVFRRELAEPLPDAAGPSAPANFHTIAALASMLWKYPGSLTERLRSARPAVQRFVATYSRPSLTWTEVGRLRRMTTLPILLKGVLDPDDARQAERHGVDGIIVSNHGGRQVDGAIAALDALPAVVDAVGRQISVLMDGGVRGGADVFKAIALGARAVLLGRPYAYGLAIAGERGVREVIRNLKAEFDLTLGLAGCGSIADATRARLIREGAVPDAG